MTVKPLRLTSANVLECSEFQYVTIGAPVWPEALPTITPASLMIGLPGPSPSGPEYVESTSNVAVGSGPDAGACAVLTVPLAHRLPLASTTSCSALAAAGSLYGGPDDVFSAPTSTIVAADATAAEHPSTTTMIKTAASRCAVRLPRNTDAVQARAALPIATHHPIKVPPSAAESRRAPDHGCCAGHSTSRDHDHKPGVPKTTYGRESASLQPCRARPTPNCWN